MPRRRSISTRLPPKPPASTRIRASDSAELVTRIRSNARARMDVLGLSQVSLARALGVTKQSIHVRIHGRFFGPGALRYLSVLLLCSVDALTAASSDAVRLAWRPGVGSEQWLPIVARILQEGRPLPSFEAARFRLLEELSGCGKDTEQSQELGLCT